MFGKKSVLTQAVTSSEWEVVSSELMPLLNHEELMFSNCGAEKDSSESLGEQRDQANPKGNKPWIFIGRTDVEPEAPILWPPELTHWERSWCWERLKTGGEGVGRGWDGWMAPPTQWTWVWANSRNWWWTRKPGMLQSMGSQRVRHDWLTELNWGNLYS